MSKGVGILKGIGCLYMTTSGETYQSLADDAATTQAEWTEH